jgi:uncharacterized membrane protein
MDAEQTKTGAVHSPAPTPRSRVQSVDALRGLVMIIMALDHVRDFFHAGAMLFQPDDLTRTNTVLFFTRWVTHICAPVFMFTAGLGAYFFGQRAQSKRRLSHFLWTRGLWLVLLELTVLRLAMNFNLFNAPVLLSVLWALGWSMVALALLAWLPPRVLAVLSLAVIALHNLADPVDASQFRRTAWNWNILHQLGIFQAGRVPVLVAYPLVPWIFVMAAGFCFGPVVQLGPLERRQWMVRTGSALCGAFLILRAVNLYGDPFRWSTEPRGMAVLSFLRVTKYPPSLDFLLVTLGPALLLLAWLDTFTLSKENPLIVFGRVPLFYFLGHLFLVHALLLPFAWLRYGRVGFLFTPLPSQGGPANLFPPDFGYPLWVVYAVWLGVIAIMYPVCRWFAQVKERNHAWWFSYL